MIKSVHLGKELTVTVINKIGVLLDIARVLAELGVNIEAVTGYTKDSEADIMVVTDDNLRAMDALKKSGYKGVKEKPVIIIELENKPGVLRNITARLASETIDIKYIYGTSCRDNYLAKVVLSTDNDERAIVLFNK